jgi:hypothetical protein
VSGGKAVVGLEPALSRGAGGKKLKRRSLLGGWVWEDKHWVKNGDKKGLKPHHKGGGREKIIKWYGGNRKEYLAPRAGLEPTT